MHGAFAESASWNDVIARLQEEGYTVIAAANPLRSLSGDELRVASIFEAIAEPIVLVGHSYGGSVISNAPRDNENVKALVYVAGFAPAVSRLHPRRSAVARPALRREHRPRYLPGGVPPAVRGRRPS